MKAILSRATLASLLLGASMLASAADIPRTPAPKGAEVFIVSPKDGATVDKTFTVEFGIKGMDLEPIDKQVPGAGHHHLLVDQKELVCALPKWITVSVAGIGWLGSGNSF